MMTSSIPCASENASGLCKESPRNPNIYRMAIPNAVRYAVRDSQDLLI